jgi:spore coat protein CotH
MHGEALGITKAISTAPYAERLFDDSVVHTLDIVIDEDDWSAALQSASDKTYVACELVVDGEACGTVAIRTKGNTSLSSVSQMDSDRYSLKIEFDHYDKGKTYYGLDKLSLNNLYSDSSYLKDYLAYHMMNEQGVAAPLSSFVRVAVNGEAFGLYLAVEGVEEALIARVYGDSAGKLYKPDNMQFGGGAGGMGGGRDNSASLVYTDDEPDSYSTIWDGAVFDYTEADQKRLIESLKKLSAGEALDEVLDVDAVLRYFVVHDFVVNFDSYTGSMQHNYYLYERDGQLSMIPWDYNLAFGTFGGGVGAGQSGGAAELVNYPIDTPVSGAELSERPMLGKLLENAEYLALYHQYFDEFISEYFESGKFAEEYDKAVALISAYVANDVSAFYTAEEFEAGTAALREFCLLRAESVRGQLDGTIPSTSEGQAADSAALVDTSGLSLSDMGAMGGGGRGGAMPAMGGNMPNMQDGQMPGGNMENGTQPGAIPADEEQRQTPGNFPTGGSPPGFQDGGQTGQEGARADFQGGRPDWEGNFPGTMDGQTAEASGISTVLYETLAAVLVLALGLVFVTRYKRF